MSVDLLLFAMCMFGALGLYKTVKANFDFPATEPKRPELSVGDEVMFVYEDVTWPNRKVVAITPNGFYVLTGSAKFFSYKKVKELVITKKAEQPKEAHINPDKTGLGKCISDEYDFSQTFYGIPGHSKDMEYYQALVQDYTQESSPIQNGISYERYMEMNTEDRIKYLKSAHPLPNAPIKNKEFGEYDYPHIKLRDGTVMKVVISG